MEVIYSIMFPISYISCVIVSTLTLETKGTDSLATVCPYRRQTRFNLV